MSYSFFIAFISLLDNMELIRKIFTSATKTRSVKELTKGRQTRHFRHYRHPDTKTLQTFRLSDSQTLRHLDTQTL